MPMPGIGGAASKKQDPELFGKRHQTLNRHAGLRPGIQKNVVDP